MKRNYWAIGCMCLLLAGCGNTAVDAEEMVAEEVVAEEIVTEEIVVEEVATRTVVAENIILSVPADWQSEGERTTDLPVERFYPYEDWSIGQMVLLCTEIWSPVDVSNIDGLEEALLFMGEDYLGEEYANTEYSFLDVNDLHVLKYECQLSEDGDVYEILAYIFLADGYYYLLHTELLPEYMDEQRGNIEKIVESVQVVERIMNTPAGEELTDENSADGVRFTFRDEVTACEEIFDTYVAYIQNFLDDPEFEGTQEEYLEYAAMYEEGLQRMDELYLEILTNEELEFYDAAAQRIIEKIEFMTYW